MVIAVIVKTLQVYDIQPEMSSLDHNKLCPRDISFCSPHQYTSYPPSVKSAIESKCSKEEAPYLSSNLFELRGIGPPSSVPDSEESLLE
jgi:hypothetical protein